MSQKTARDRADKYFSLLIRARDKVCQADPCRYPDKGYRLECCHVYTRNYSATRCDFDNALAMCAGCHRLMHARPTEFGELILNRLGRTRLDQLRLRAVPATKVDWESEADLLAAMWKQAMSTTTSP